MDIFLIPGFLHLRSDTAEDQHLACLAIIIETDRSGTDHRLSSIDTIHPPPPSTMESFVDITTTTFQAILAVCVVFTAGYAFNGKRGGELSTVRFSRQNGGRCTTLLTSSDRSRPSSLWLEISYCHVSYSRRSLRRQCSPGVD